MHFSVILFELTKWYFVPWLWTIFVWQKNKTKQNSGVYSVALTSQQLWLSAQDLHKTKPANVLLRSSQPSWRRYREVTAFRRERVSAPQQRGPGRSPTLQRLASRWGDENPKLDSAGYVKRRKKEGMRLEGGWGYMERWGWIWEEVMWVWSKCTVWNSQNHC